MAEPDKSLLPPGWRDQFVEVEPGVFVAERSWPIPQFPKPSTPAPMNGGDEKSAIIFALVIVLVVALTCLVLLARQADGSVSKANAALADATRGLRDELEAAKNDLAREGEERDKLKAQVARLAATNSDLERRLSAKKPDADVTAALLGADLRRLSTLAVEAGQARGDLTVAMTERAWASVFKQVGYTEVAVALLSSSTKRLGRVVKADPEITFETALELGEQLNNVGRFADAETAFVQAESLAPAHDSLLFLRAQLGRAHALFGQEKFEEANKLSERVLTAARKADRVEGRRLFAEALMLAGTIHEAMNQAGPAIKAYEAALSVLEKAFGEESDELVPVLRALAWAFSRVEREDAATRAMARIIAIERRRG